MRRICVIEVWALCHFDIFLRSVDGFRDSCPPEPGGRLDIFREFVAVCTSSKLIWNSKLSVTDDELIAKHCNIKIHYSAAYAFECYLI